MIESIFGNETTALIFLNIYHYGEIHTAAISRNTGKFPRAIINQLNNLEEKGLLVSKTVGKSRLYLFNGKSPYIKHLKEIIKITYDSLPIKLKENLFKESLRPRKKGRPVINEK